MQFVMTRATEFDLTEKQCFTRYIELQEANIQRFTRRRVYRDLHNVCYKKRGKMMMIQENDHAVSPIDDSEDGARSALVLRLLGLGRGLSHADLGDVVVLGPDTTTPRQLTEGLGFNS